MRNPSKWALTRESRSVSQNIGGGFLVAALVLVGGQASAALDDPTAETIYLKKSCGTLANCTSSVGTLNQWIEDTRRPNATSPLVVNIGPGTFSDDSLRLSCNKPVGFRGYISFIGSGRDITTIGGNGSHRFGMSNACQKMSFQALALKNNAPSGSTGAYGVVDWSFGGSSTWTDVLISGEAYAWWSSTCGGVGSAPGSHYWYNSLLKVSRSVTLVATTYSAGCDESWFYGSELSMALAADDPASDRAVVVDARTQSGSASAGIVHIYGSVLRTNNSAASGRMRGVIAEDGGEVHLHGVGMDFVSSSGNPATALSAFSGGHIHAAATAYSVQTSGSFTRVLDGGGTDTMIDAPFFWGAQPASLLERVYSVDGEDTAIDTATADGRPHSLVYQGSCGRRWYDATAGACW